ncbi:hypothetical protein WJX72_005999 [[Myrmecia] bisecta]|uniref:F-box domain-containing protein n=1 Tax=[Myrmecia] bisecta TaxID=41462 RepID=A0AAW1PT49_9CHLO
MPDHPKRQVLDTTEAVLKHLHLNQSAESGLHSVDHDQDRQRSCQMEDLDDACLINIFSCLTPLDLSSVSRTCRRFRELTTDGRMWLLVSTEVGPERRLSASGRHCRCMFPTLQEAVAASRPGDTIVIEPGQTHIAQDVAIFWPLQLLGGGSKPESTVLTCPKGEASALVFRATAKMANLTVRATMGACVIHRWGRLFFEGCMLHCDLGNLDCRYRRIIAPLVSYAAQSVTSHRHAFMCPHAGQVARTRWCFEDGRCFLCQ